MIMTNEDMNPEHLLFYPSCLLSLLIPEFFCFDLYLLKFVRRFGGIFLKPLRIIINQHSSQVVLVKKLYTVRCFKLLLSQDQRSRLFSRGEYRSRLSREIFRFSVQP